ncbi:hypothetical protein BOO71_0003163 [Deinococcus marmoris]|uniref:Uncharacterized protein n=1 Tax=Deinococcus marmoris TaxID=249408 RepID=A0A1U7P2C8_9DEIO|nr:hypothetical protein BOO71_0003163 [Deinococcus marmoris]
MPSFPPGIVEMQRPDERRGGQPVQDTEKMARKNGGGVHPVEELHPA